MFSFLRRKPPTPPLPAAPTFNERVTAFWKWFEEVAPRFYATIEDGKCADLTDETSAMVDKFLPGFSWVYGPGANGSGHSFTLTGEGDIHRQLLALHWLSQAPVIEGWTFHAARQPGEIKGHVIEMHDLRFDPKEIWVTPTVDEENEKIDLTIWHPAWERLEDRQKYSITFIFLDEALGEYGTGWWIGEIALSKAHLSKSFPLEELAAFVNSTSRKQEWKKFPPGESWTLYSAEEVDNDFPRSDISTLSTAVPKLFQQYMNAKGKLEDPLGGTGADYVYVSITKDYFPQGGEVAKRGELEDALTATLEQLSAGRVVSGAFSAERAYIDLLVYDGKRSLDAIQKTLRAQNVPAGTMIEFFAREKRTQRIAL
jgi:hypothetical protein